MKSKKISSVTAGLALAALAVACSGGGINISTQGPVIPGIPGSLPGTLQFRDTSFDAAEGTVVNILVARSNGSSGVARVDYATADGTAVGGSDYDAASGTLTWPNGVSGNRTISIHINDDEDGEVAESFTVTLSNVSGATLGAMSSATVNITDNDAVALKATGNISAVDDFAVNGIHYDTTAARIVVNGLPAVVSDLDPGQVVSLEGEVNFSTATGRADRISYSAMLIGPAGRTDAILNQLVVMDQTVLTDPDTVIDLHGKAEVAPGDIVEVSGFAAADGAIHATRIERNVTAARHQIVGTVAELDPGKLSFRVNSLTLDYGNAIVIDLEGGMPVNGVTIRAIGTMNRGVFVVEQLMGVAGLAGAPGERVQAAGLVTRHDPPLGFDIGDKSFAIVAGASYLNGDTSKLALDKRLTVDGKFLANGWIAANRITLGRHDEQAHAIVGAGNVLDYRGGIDAR